MIRDVTLKTCRRRWMIGRRGERGSEISVLAARHDDDDEVYIISVYLTISFQTFSMIFYLCVCVICHLRYTFPKRWQIYFSMRYEAKQISSRSIARVSSLRQWSGRAGFNPSSSHTKDSKNGTCLTLSIIRYGSRVLWSNPGKGVEPSPTLWCSSYRKGSLPVTLDSGRQLYFTYTFHPNMSCQIYLLPRYETKKSQVLLCVQVFYNLSHLFTAIGLWRIFYANKIGCFIFFSFCSWNKSQWNIKVHPTLS